MCGITGIWNIQQSEQDLIRIVQAMTDAQKHRGPDNGHVEKISDGVVFGHRRLSIIDTSPDGHQPMHRANCVITYNGELYNYRSERQRLEAKGIAFKTNSDTEVLLALYEEKGPDFVKDLNGIFAFALYDKEKQMLICARDHFGIKPFNYIQSKGGLIFASEFKGLLASGLIERSIDMDALALLLKKGSVPQPYTLIKGVKSLLPGHVMVCSKSEVEIKRYYTPSPAKLSVSSDQEYKEMVHELLFQTVQDQLVSDVPIGAFLSGGVDSGLICAMMKKAGGDVKTYSVGFEAPQGTAEYDETNEAAMVAEHLGIEHTTFTISEQEAKSALLPIIKGLDQPGIDGLNSYFVSSVAAKSLRAALSGTGGDEGFGGYEWFPRMAAFHEANPLQRLKRMLRGRDEIAHYDSFHGVFSKSLAQDLLGHGVHYVDTYGPVRETLKNFDTTVSRTSCLVMGSFLQNQLLPDIDKASMAHSLEVRVPFLSQDVVETAMALPDHLKIGQPDHDAEPGSYVAEGTKKILVDIAADYLPEGYDTRPKRGFALPMNHWLSSIWSEPVKDVLSYETVKRRGLFDPEAVQSIINDAPWTQTWLLASIELWCQEVLEG